jgi:hypothetical protein
MFSSAFYFFITKAPVANSAAMPCTAQKHRIEMDFD